MIRGARYKVMLLIFHYFCWCTDQQRARHPYNIQRAGERSLCCVVMNGQLVPLVAAGGACEPGAAMVLTPAYFLHPSDALIARNQVRTHIKIFYQLFFSANQSRQIENNILNDTYILLRCLILHTYSRCNKIIALVKLYI